MEGFSEKGDRPGASSPPRGRCVWCRGHDGALHEITVATRDRFASPQQQTFLVHPRHEDYVRAFAARYRRHGGRFLAVLLLTSVALTIGGLVFSFALGESVALVFVGGVLALEGTLIVAFPFCTPETVRWLGLRRATHLSSIGGGVAALGVGIASWSAWL